jgi:hypothetical protein
VRSSRSVNARSDLISLCAVALALAVTAGGAGCPEDLLANAPCEGDENCPNGLVCSDDNVCVDAADLGEGEGEEGEGEGEEGEGEGEGEEGEGEGEEGEGEGEEGEGEGEEGEGEGEGDQDCSPGEIEIGSTEELQIFEGCTTIEGDIVLFGDGIGSFAALSDVVTVDGNITFVDLGEADNEEALSGLTVITGDLEINGDDGEEIVDALVDLEEVGNDLFIIETEIVTLRGFSFLTSIGGDLLLADNPFLASLGDGAFASLEFIGESVVLENNPSLPVCFLEGLAEVANGEPALDDQGGNDNETVCDGEG